MSAHATEITLQAQYRAHHHAQLLAHKLATVATLHHRGRVLTLLGERRTVTLQHLLAPVHEVKVRALVCLCARAREPAAHVAAVARLHEHDRPVAHCRLFALLLLPQHAELSPRFRLGDDAVPQPAHRPSAEPTLQPLHRHRDALLAFELRIDRQIVDQLDPLQSRRSSPPPTLDARSRACPLELPHQRIVLQHILHGFQPAHA